ncbi:MAG: hypothetical protein HYU37_06240 [Acidobacteria bacterium]|nr:hypothetical protein [Acidobacteriota bacterium]
MNRMVLLLVAGVVLVAGTSRVAAHHSFGATYDSSQRIEIEGVVKEFVWRNPHSFLRIDVTDKAGVTKTWALEWGSISQLTEAKLTRTTLRPGDRLVITGEPARDQSSPRLLIVSMRRPADGWSWQGRVD